jgi:hypothetical protein
MSRCIVVTFVVLVALVASMTSAAAADITTGRADVDLWQIRDFSIGVVSPWAKDASGFGVASVGIKVLPVDQPEVINIQNCWYTVPQYFLATSALEVMAPLNELESFSLDDLFLGASIHGVTIEAGIPVRLGANYTEYGWGWHVVGELWEF